MNELTGHEPLAEDVLGTLLSLSAATYRISVDGVRPSTIPGQGFGVVATRDLRLGGLMVPKIGETIVNIPSAAMRTLDNTPKLVVSKLPSTASVHCVLAVSLLLDRTPFLDAWKKAMPTPHELLDSMPIAWKPDLDELLPTGAARVLGRQRAKFSRDWIAAHASFPNLTHGEFFYAWLLVNTRSFHHVTPATKSLPLRDQMILQPIADLFNHDSNGGCRGLFGRAGFTATTHRPHKAGEEVTFCYGNHSNDVLLVEYGFIAPANQWDEVVLDDAIMPRLTCEQQAWLEEYDLFGKYCIDAESVCYRTEAAIRAMILPEPNWARFARGEDDGQESLALAREILRATVTDYTGHIDEVMVTLSRMGLGKHHSLFQRWLQVASILQLSVRKEG